MNSNNISLEQFNHYLSVNKDWIGTYLSFVSVLVSLLAALIAFLVYRGAKKWVFDHLVKNKLSSIVLLRSDLLKLKALSAEFNGCRNLSCAIISNTAGQLSAVSHAKAHTILNEHKTMIFNCFSPSVGLLSDLKVNLRDLSNSINNGLLVVLDSDGKSDDYKQLVSCVEKINDSLNKINIMLSDALIEIMRAQSNILTYDNGKSLADVKNENMDSARNLNVNLSGISAIYSEKLNSIIDDALNIKAISII